MDGKRGKKIGEEGKRGRQRKGLDTVPGCVPDGSRSACSFCLSEQVRHRRSTLSPENESAPAAPAPHRSTLNAVEVSRARGSGSVSAGRADNL